MSTPSLKTLADRVRLGDGTAAPQLRKDLATPLRRLARRALRPSTPASSFVTRVRDMAREIADREGYVVTGSEPWFLAQLARELCDEVLTGLLQEAPSVRGSLNTVCA